MIMLKRLKTFHSLKWIGLPRNTEFLLLIAVLASTFFSTRAMDQQTQSYSQPNGLLLKQAAAVGNVEDVRRLILEGADVNYQQKISKQTAMHQAAKNGMFVAVCELLASGADPNAQDNHGQTPLHCAVIAGDKTGCMEVVEMLLKNNKTLVDSKDSKVLTPFNYASEAGLFEVAKRGCVYIFEKYFASQKKSSPDELAMIDQIVNKSGQTLLMVACANAQAECVKCLLQEHVNLECICSAGLTALHYAVSKNCLEIVALFCGLDNRACINAVDSRGNTPLNLAVKRGFPEIVSALIIAGGSLNAANARGRTPLYRALKRRFFNLAIILVNEGADPNKPVLLYINPSDERRAVTLMESLNSLGVYPVHIAATYGEVEFMEALINARASLNGICWPDMTALHLAAAYDHPRIIATLLRSRANDSPTSVYFTHMHLRGVSALFLAFFLGHYDCVREFFNYGNKLEKAKHLMSFDNTNTWNPSKTFIPIEGHITPSNLRVLNYASWKGWGDIVALLIEANAPLDTQSSDYLAALELAVLAGKLETVAVVLQAKAKLARGREPAARLLTDTRYTEHKNCLEIGRLLIRNDIKNDALSGLNSSMVDKKRAVLFTVLRAQQLGRKIYEKNYPIIRIAVLQ